MSIPIQAYTVLSEFQFEIGNAIVNSEKVQSAVDGISQSADNALNSLKSLGIGFVGQFGLGATSVIGIFGKAITASDDFYRSQLVFANIISSNMKNMTGEVGTFNDRMNVGARILKDISKDAAKFGLPEGALADMTKLMAGTLAPKGLAGPNFGIARDMSRDLLKSAPVLGVNPADVQGQLLRSIQGGASMGDPLFRSLSAETEIFKEKFKGATDVAKRFNKLPIAERLNVLREGLSQFAKDADVLAGNAATLRSMLTRLRDVFTGFNGILIPLGNALLGPVREGITGIIKTLDTDGRIAMENFAKVIKVFASDITGTATNLMQAKELGADFKMAGQAGFGVVIVQFLQHFGLLGLALKAILIPFALVLKALAYLVPVLGMASKVFMFLAAATAKFSLVMLPFLAVFQTISRSMAIARINDLKAIPNAIAQVSEQLTRIGALFNMVFGGALALMDTVAGSMSFLFEFTFYLEKVGVVMEFLTNVFVTLFALVRGFIFVIGQAVNDIFSGNLRGMGGRLKGAFTTGVDDFFDQFLQKTQKEDGNTNTVGNVTNIDTVNIQNAFKEQLEPDRIAFTIKDQLLKAAMNPTAATGRSLRGAEAM